MMKNSLAMINDNCHGMGMSGGKEGRDMGMMNMMMKMMDQQSNMMGMPMNP